MSVASMGRAQNITESDPSETLAANLAAMHNRGHLFGACKDRGASSHCNRGRLTTSVFSHKTQTGRGANAQQWRDSSLQTLQRF
jgi:hypothetical protein